MAWPPARSAEPVAQSVDWYRFDLPPLYIADGELQNRGIIDVVLSRLLKELFPDQLHQTTTMPLKRIEMQLRQTPHACVLGMLKNPERERDMLFSAPFLTQLPPGVFARRKDEALLAPYADRDGKLSLTRLLRDGRLKVGVVGGRSYGATLDTLLAAEGRNHTYVSYATKPYQSLMQMALAGRVDVLPGFPYEAEFVSRQEGLDLRAMRFYALSEQPKFLLGYAACSKSELGQATIRKINAVLARKDFRDHTQSVYESWLDEDGKRLARRAHKLAQ